MVGWKSCSGDRCLMVVQGDFTGAEQILIRGDEVALHMFKEGRQPGVLRHNKQFMGSSCPHLDQSNTFISVETESHCRNKQKHMVILHTNRSTWFDQWVAKSPSPGWSTDQSTWATVQQSRQPVTQSVWDCFIHIHML